MIVCTLFDLDPEATEQAWTTGFIRRCLACVRAKGGHFGHRSDPKRGQREVARDFSVLESEGKLFGAACGCFDNTTEFHVRCRKGCELRGRGRALHELSHAMNVTLWASVPSPTHGVVGTKG